MYATRSGNHNPRDGRGVWDGRHPSSRCHMEVENRNVGNIPYQTTEDAIGNYVSQAGQVTN
ncbi:hypothetical protein ANCDUO_18233, partial [Ancylostoma duodenale]